jgi:subfamily B ATP-binding cassette protein MsbA
MSKKIQQIKNANFVKNYKRMWPFVKPYWGRALLAILITIPIGAMDAVIAWALKPYMDVVMVQKGSVYTAYIPLLIILFTLLLSVLNYTATYMNTWVGQKVSMSLKKDLYKKLLRYHAGFFDKQNSGDVVYRFNSDVDASCNGLLANLKLFTTRLFSSISLVFVLFSLPELRYVQCQNLEVDIHMSFDIHHQVL